MERTETTVTIETDRGFVKRREPSLSRCIRREQCPHGILPESRIHGFLTLSHFVVTISLIIPAYNEEERLPAFLESLARFHQISKMTIAEVLVVDDGSSDQTSTVAAKFSGRLPLRVIRLPRNRGKGAAVQTGVEESRGDAIIFMDADGATGPEELPKLLAGLERKPIAVGNRWMRGSIVADREILRAFSGWVYRTYMGFFGLAGVDTMCGFKGFHRDAAKRLFSSLTEERWLFDTEVMLRARRHGMPIENVPISWTSKHGSKLKFSALMRSAFQIPIVAFRVARETRTSRSAA